MPKQKVMLALTDEALAIIERNGGERKRGEFVSACVLDWEKRRRQEQDLKGGILERIEQKVTRIENALANGNGKPV